MEQGKEGSRKKEKNQAVHAMEEGSYRDKSVEARMDQERNAVEGIEGQESKKG